MNVPDLKAPAAVLAFAPDSFERMFGSFPQPALIMAEAGMACVAANAAAIRLLNGNSQDMRSLDLESICSATDVSRWLNVRESAADAGWLTWERQQRGQSSGRMLQVNAIYVEWQGEPAELQLYADPAELAADPSCACGPLASLAACGLGRYSMDRHRLTFANPALSQMLGGLRLQAGSADGSEPSADHFAAAFLYEQEWARFLDNAEAGKPFEQACTWRAGLTARVRMRLIAQPEETPRGREVIFSAINAGPELAREQQGQQSQRMEALGRMAGGVAHDFNNLLLVIRGHAELIEEDLPDGSELRQHTARLLSAARQAAEITGTLLTFSRQEQADTQPVSLRQALSEALQLAGPLLGPCITLDSDIGADVTIAARSSHIQQVVMNLAVNARDAMPDGGTLTVRSGWERGDGREAGLAVLEVSDTGVGMDSETKSHIFEPFYTTKSRGRGTGLGLALVYAIVAQYDGTIEVDSEPGRGTTFRVKLPALAIPDATSLKKPPEAARGGCKVLLVDDEPEIRQMVGAFLERLGYQVVQAADAREALVCACSHGSSIDLLLTDVVMPHTDGFELALMLREQLPHLPVVVMSGFTGGALARKGRELGDVPFLSKPFSLRQLEACLKSVVKGQHAVPAFA